MRHTRARCRETTYKKQLEMGRMLQGHCKPALSAPLVDLLFHGRFVSLPAKGCAVLGSR